jgi:hypothetical protein
LITGDAALLFVDAGAVDSIGGGERTNCSFGESGLTGDDECVGGAESASALLGDSFEREVGEVNPFGPPSFGDGDGLSSPLESISIESTTGDLEGGLIDFRDSLYKELFRAQRSNNRCRRGMKFRFRIGVAARALASSSSMSHCTLQSTYSGFGRFTTAVTGLLLTLAVRLFCRAWTLLVVLDDGDGRDVPASV